VYQQQLNSQLGLGMPQHNNVANPAWQISYQPAMGMAKHIQSPHERSAAIGLSGSYQQDLAIAYSHPDRMHNLSAHAQMIVGLGKGDDPKFYASRSGPVPFLFKQYLGEFKRDVRERGSNLDASDFAKIMAGNIFGINLRDAEPYSGNPLAEKKEKMPDDLPVHGLQTLTMLLRHLEPHLAICRGLLARGSRRPKVAALPMGPRLLLVPPHAEGLQGQVGGLHRNH
jgi:hypothetical protein